MHGQFCAPPSKVKGGSWSSTVIVRCYEFDNEYIKTDDFSHFNVNSSPSFLLYTPIHSKPKISFHKHPHTQTWCRAPSLLWLSLPCWPAPSACQQHPPFPSQASRVALTPHQPSVFKTNGAHINNSCYSRRLLSRSPILAALCPTASQSIIQLSHKLKRLWTSSPRLIRIRFSKPSDASSRQCNAPLISPFRLASPQLCVPDQIVCLVSPVSKHTLEPNFFFVKV